MPQSLWPHSLSKPTQQFPFCCSRNRPLASDSEACRRHDQTAQSPVTAMPACVRVRPPRRASPCGARADLSRRCCQVSRKQPAQHTCTMRTKITVCYRQSPPGNALPTP